jgi:hypothetical protein
MDFLVHDYTTSNRKQNFYKKIRSADWYLNEKPRAYAWDPELVEFFEKFYLEVEIRERFLKKYGGRLITCLTTLKSVMF